MTRLLGLLLLSLTIATASATTYNSDGTENSINSLNASASDGDTITVPSGTFTWRVPVVITKGITLSGQNVITGAGTETCTSNDATVIIDELDHAKTGKILAVTVPTGKAFRLTGITFRKGTSTTYGSDGGVTINSNGLVTNVRVDNCHFDHLYWNAAFQLLGYVLGVQDHCLVESNSQGFSALIFHNGWNGVGENASWADYPYFGSEKFFFFETNTYVATGNDISGTFDSFRGGRWVVRHCFMLGACAPGGHGTEAGGVRGERCQQVYDNTFKWLKSYGGHSHRSGSVIWHDNLFLGVNSNNGAHTSLPYFRQLGAVGNDLSNWGLADGENGWDINDPHGIYLSGTSTSNTTINGSAGRFTTGTTMSVNQFQGMQVRNDHIGSACYLHSAFIIDNDTTSIHYYYYGAGDRGAPLIFNLGDEFSIRGCITALDQAGRGKGDLISPSGPRAWPNEQQEPCFSWNNKNTDTGQVLGFNSSIPTQHLGTDYINLGAGLSVDTIPASVTAAYPVNINGIEAYTHEFQYPHPLVSGASPTPTYTPTPTATASPTPSATATGTPPATPTATVTATATFTPTATPTATATTTETPTGIASVILSTEPANLKAYWKCDDPSGSRTLIDSSGNSKQLTVNGASGINYFLGEAGESGTCFRTDGVSGYAYRADGVLPTLDNTNFTVFVLVKGGTDFNCSSAVSIANASHERTVVQLGNNRSGPDYSQAEGKVRGNAITDFGAPISGGVAFDGSWHTEVWRRTGDVFDLFVDGDIVATRSSILTLGGSLNRTSLMHTMNPSNPPATFALGSVQHAAIWNTALSDEEILGIEGARASPTPTPTATGTPSPTSTFTPTATATATYTPTATATSSPTPTATATESPTPTATATATFTPTPTATPCLKPDIAPTDLSCEQASPTPWPWPWPAQNNLSWADNSSNEDGFKIERGTNGLTWNILDKVGPNTTTYLDTSVDPSVIAYYYRVRAFTTCDGIDQDSGYTNISACGTTPSPTTTPTATPTATPVATATATATTTPEGVLPAPTELSNTVTVGHGHKRVVNLTWINNAGQLIEVWRGDSECASMQLIKKLAPSTGTRDSVNQPGETFCYKVRSYDSQGRGSDFSTETVADIP